MSDTLDVLLLRVGTRSFALPLEQVQHVAALPPDFAAQGPAVASHFVFADQPLPYVSLWNHFSLESAYAEYAQIEAMLPKRRQDHLDWMGALEYSIRSATPFSKARSPRDCAFGQWFYAYHTDNAELSVFLSQFEQPHAQIHQLADRLLACAESGQQDVALAALEDSRNTILQNLLELFDSTATLAHNLQRRIAIIGSDRQQPLAVGADAVMDMLKLSAASLKPAPAQPAGPQRVIVALLLLPDHSVAPLLDMGALAAATTY